MWIHTTTEQLPLGLSSSSAISKVTVGCDGPPSVYVLNPSCTVVSWPHLDVICLLTTLAPSGSFALNFLIHYGFQWIVTSFDATKVAFFLLLCYLAVSLLYWVLLLLSCHPLLWHSPSTNLCQAILPVATSCSCFHVQLYYIVCVYLPAPLTHSIPSLPSVC